MVFVGCYWSISDSTKKVLTCSAVGKANHQQNRNESVAERNQATLNMSLRQFLPVTLGDAVVAVFGAMLFVVAVVAAVALVVAVVDIAIHCCCCCCCCFWCDAAVVVDVAIYCCWCYFDCDVCDVVAFCNQRNNSYSF